jgi:hypothetical protein
VSLAGWMNRQQQQYAIDYLQEEIRVLKEQQGDGRPRFADNQGRRLAGKVGVDAGLDRIAGVGSLVLSQTSRFVRFAGSTHV